MCYRRINTSSTAKRSTNLIAQIIIDFPNDRTQFQRRHLRTPPRWHGVDVCCAEFILRVIKIYLHVLSFHKTLRRHKLLKFVLVEDQGLQKPGVDGVEKQSKAFSYYHTVPSTNDTQMPWHRNAFQITDQQAVGQAYRRSYLSFATIYFLYVITAVKFRIRLLGAV